MLKTISLREADTFWFRSFRPHEFDDECFERSRKLRRLNSDSNFMASEDFLENPLKGRKCPKASSMQIRMERKLLSSRQHKNPRYSYCVDFPRTSTTKEIIEISDDDDEEEEENHDKTEQEIEVLMEWEKVAAKQSAKDNRDLKEDSWQDARSFRNKPCQKRAIQKDRHSKTSNKLLMKMSNSSQDDDDEVKIIKETKPPPHTVSVFTTPRPAAPSVCRHLDSANSKYKFSTQKQSSSSVKSSSLSSKCTEETKKLAINEVASAEDKHLYSAVLQRFTEVPVNLLQRMPVPRNTREAEETLSSIELSKTKPQHKTAVQFIDLTTLEEPLCSKSREAIKTQGSDCHTSSRDDEAKMPIRYSNSLEESLKSRDVYHEDYTKSIKEKYEKKQKELEQQRKIEELKAGHSAMKNKKVHVESIERLTRYLKITGAEVLPPPESKPTWPRLTAEEQKEIDAALFPKPAGEALVEAFSLKITRRDMHTLSDRNWLNDEVINFYMNLLIERGKQENYPKVYAFNTFFYPKLITGGHQALKRWTRKIDIFSYKMVFVPVHLGMHWCMAVINFDAKTVKYYDSMGTPNDNCLMALLTYLRDESMDKKKEKYDTRDWKLENVKDIPHQMNGSDCGVFSCMYAEFIAREAKITFTQEDMPYCRRKMVYEIKKARLLI